MKAVHCALLTLFIIHPFRLLVEPKPASHPTVCMLLDATSSDRRGVHFVEAARVIYAACPPGCRIHIIRIMQRDVTVVFSATKDGTGDQTRRLASIPTTWEIPTRPTDYAYALNFYTHLKFLRRLARGERAAVVAITHGAVGSKQSQEIIVFAERIKSARGWPFLLVSTADRTEKSLLTAAKEGRLHWANIERLSTSPALEKCLRTLQAPPPNDPPPDPAAATTESPAEVTPGVTENTTRESADPNDGLTKNRTTPVGDPNVPNEPDPNEEPHAVYARARAEPNASATGRRFEALRSLVDPPTSPLKRRDISRDEAEARFGDPHTTVQLVGGELTESVPKRSKGQSPNTPDSKPAGGHASTFQRVRNAVWTPLAVAGISIGGLLVGALGVTFAQARRWERRIHQVLPANVSARDQRWQLTAQTAAGSFPLGDLDGFRRAFVGSAPDNTVVLREDGVAERHVCIERRKKKLWLRNLTREPVRINGHELKAKRRRPVTLPTTIELGDTARLHLFAEGSSADDEPFLEESNEQEDQ